MFEKPGAIVLRLVELQSVKLCSRSSCPGDCWVYVLTAQL